MLGVSLRAPNSCSMQATELMKITFEAGINFFDNSEHYGKGEILGAQRWARA